MSCSHFLDQVEVLMHTQNARNSEYLQKTHYHWLSSKKKPLIFMSARDELMIRQAFQKINEQQQQQALKKLIVWLEEHPKEDAQKVPEMCWNFLNNIFNSELINKSTLVRKGSFRRSLKRLSILSNKVDEIVMKSELWTFVTRTGSDFVQDMNKVISTLRESGLIDYQRTQKDYIRYSEETQDSTENVVIGMEHVYLIFLFWVAGIVIARVTFVLEHVTYYIKNR
ncbi:hypothetical protein FQA39_LY01767 [Lamprigera yunnana]|nr:hypothetical protein FQA39_LY01767 [Lamprigera yunnana]